MIGLTWPVIPSLTLHLSSFCTCGAHNRHRKRPVHTPTSTPTLKKSACHSPFLQWAVAASPPQLHANILLIQQWAVAAPPPQLHANIWLIQQWAVAASPPQLHANILLIQQWAVAAPPPQLHANILLIQQWAVAAPPPQLHANIRNELWQRFCCNCMPPTSSAMSCGSVSAARISMPSEMMRDPRNAPKATPTQACAIWCA